MTHIRGLGFPVKKDFFLKKGTNLYFASDENKFWFEADDEQITLPRQGFKIKDDSENRLWLIKNKTKSA
jgi:hypothetical protein